MDAYDSDTNAQRIRELEAQMDSMRATLDEMPCELELNRKSDEVVRTAREAVRETQEESRRLGVANVYFIDGRTYYELPNGDYTQTPLPGYDENGK